MIKYIAGLLGTLFAFLIGGATFTLQTTDVTALGGAFDDIATSLIDVIVKLLPVAVPVLVVGFILSVIMAWAHRR